MSSVPHFRAILVTYRTVERAVQFFGTSRTAVEKESLSWLQRNGHVGDRFDLSEMCEVPAGSVTMAGRFKDGSVEVITEAAVECIQ